MKLFLILVFSLSFAANQDYTHKFILPMLTGQRDWLVGDNRVTPKISSLCDLAFGVLYSDNSVDRSIVLDFVLANPRVTKSKLKQIIEIKKRRAMQQLSGQSLRFKKIECLCDWFLSQLDN
jgi:hypothetical protein